jgi:hypothetical protein
VRSRYLFFALPGRVEIREIGLCPNIIGKKCYILSQCGGYLFFVGAVFIPARIPALYSTGGDKPRPYVDGGYHAE